MRGTARDGREPSGCFVRIGGAGCTWFAGAEADASVEGRSRTARPAPAPARDARAHRQRCTGCGRLGRPGRWRLLLYERCEDVRSRRGREVPRGPGYRPPIRRLAREL